MIFALIVVVVKSSLVSIIIISSSISTSVKWTSLSSSSSLTSSIFSHFSWNGKVNMNFSSSMFLSWLSETFFGRIDIIIINKSESSAVSILISNNSYSSNSTTLFESISQLFLSERKWQISDNDVLRLCWVGVLIEFCMEFWWFVSDECFVFRHFDDYVSAHHFCSIEL